MGFVLKKPGRVMLRAAQFGQVPTTATCCQYSLSIWLLMYLCFSLCKLPHNKNALETHSNSSLCVLKARSQNLEQKSMKEKFVIKIEHLSVVFKTVCMELKYFHVSNII